MYFLPKRSCAVILAVMGAISVAGLASCGGSSKEDPVKTDKAEEVDLTGPEYTSAYVCPMHCEGSGSDQPGKCPFCGMDYVSRAEDEADHTQ